MLRGPRAKEITQELFERLCEAMCVPVIPLPGKRTFTKGAYATAFVNRYFAAETNDARNSIIDRILRTKAEEIQQQLPADLLDVLDCLEKSETAEYRDLKKDAEVALKFKGISQGPRNSTLQIVKDLVPAGVVLCRMSVIRCYESCRRSFLPKRWFARRWGGPIAQRTELEALSQVLNLVWDVDANYNPEHDSSKRPSQEQITDVVSQLQQRRLTMQRAAAPYMFPKPLAIGRGRGRGRGRGSLVLASAKAKGKAKAKSKAAPKPKVAAKRRAAGRGSGR